MSEVVAVFVGFVVSVACDAEDCCLLDLGSGDAFLLLLRFVFRRLFVDEDEEKDEVQRYMIDSIGRSVDCLRIDCLIDCD